MSNNLQPSLYSSANNSTSTLRPRNARLISYTNDEWLPTDTVPEAISTSNSASRTASPASHTRARSLAAGQGKTAKATKVRTGSENGGRRSSNGLWESWSQIQGIASTILGSDVPSGSGARKPIPTKTPAWMRQDRTYSILSSEQKWGPRTQDVSTVGSKSIEERQAMLQAKRREALLMSTAEESRDVSGRFKRKGSDSSLASRSPTVDSGEEALVYRHRVQPNDTLAGVAIKYNCQPEAFRKVNRFWPNDNIQTRKQVLLPVDACTIRGRKIDGPNSPDLLADDLTRTNLETSSSQPAEGTQNVSIGSETLIHNQPKSDSTDEDYKHDSWIQFSSFSHPTEIIRISRRTLGYFPPARRKSNHHLLPESTATSPRTSFDTLRHPPSHAAQQAQLQQQQTTVSLNASPVRLPRLSPQSNRQRSSSTVSVSTVSSSAAHNNFVSALRGPGGVGTLRGLRTEVSRPGPADDSLNQRFAKYLPDVAPPAIADGESLLQHGVPPLGTARTFSSLTLAPPRLSMDSARSGKSTRSNSGSTTFAGVENWVKKIATSTRPGTQRMVNDRPIGIGGDTGLGDLIELEVNDLEELPTLGNDSNSNQKQCDGTITSLPSTMTRQETDLLNERFPIRGRITKAYGA